MRKMTFIITLFIVSLLAFISGDSPAQSPPPPPPPPVLSGSIVNTKHNLSVSGTGTVKSTVEQEICIFCHAPHHARADVAYLWNRNEPADNYTPYQSSTLYATVGQPTGASKLCLSCHDGTIALGQLVSRTNEIPFEGGIRFMPEGSGKIGTDLSDDHPVSFVYNDALATARGELVFPSSLPPEIKLDKTGQLQCTSCHDPHKNINGQFLVLPNISSNLCTTCHQTNGWNLSSHSLSNATWNGNGANPWPHTSYTTVSENGCENCHKPHTAGKHERILNYEFEEDNCLICHNGNLAGTNISAEITKPYKHGVQNYINLHDPIENFTTQVPKHVECEDCHNPHQSNENPSSGAPQISGKNNGVSGINTSGQQIEVSANQFEICFKCHGDNNVITAASVDRQIQQLNTRLEFMPSNPSYHPVETQGANMNVPSLVPPYTTASIIFCTDCHNSDDPNGPQGPHGSTNKNLLERYYTTIDNTQENSYNYALCYKCHNRSSILNDESFKFHSRHIQVENTPCSACHDAHGISSSQGDSVNNSNLINFDVTIVSPYQGNLYFRDLGVFSGECNLTCHGRDHGQRTYP